MGKKQEKFETPSDSDRSSDYVTGLEDFPDCTTMKNKENSESERFRSCISDPCNTSFIQNILYEDSCAEVKVVDLFVAVKRVKDYVDFLSRCNSGLTEKINELHRGTGVIRKEYANLLKNMQEFLDKMNDDVTVWNILIPRRKSPGMVILPENIVQINPKDIEQEFDREETEESQQEPQSKSKFDFETSTTRRPNSEKSLNNGKKEFEEHKKALFCSECGKDSSEKSNVRCLQCLVSNFKEKGLYGQGLIVPEALLGSFLASLLWLQKERSSGGQASEKYKRNDNTLNLESAVQMICEILDKNICQKPKGKDSSSLKSAEEMDDDVDWWSGVSCASESQDRGTSLLSKATPSDGLTDEVSSWTDNLNSKSKSRDDGRLKASAISENESDFEEALSETSRPSFQCDGITQPSANCMGDLTKAVMGKKSASTLTPSTDVSAWVGKLSDDIRSKIKNFKSKTKVKVLEGSARSFKSHVGASQFTITANAPLGLFDVTVVQFKKRPHLRREEKLKKTDSNPSDDCPPLSGVADLKDDYWSEDSLQSSEYESLDTGSQSSEDDMEEFLEIYVEKFKKSKKTENLVTSSLTTGVFLRLEQKWVKTQHSKLVELNRCRNSMNEEEVISLNAGEKRQKQVVIQGSSEDLIIFIQVEVEDGSIQSPDGLVLEYQTNSLGTQTREDSLQQICFFEGKVIKLGKSEPNGESLYDIWSQPEDAKEQDKITLNESPLTIQKTESEKQLNKHKTKVVYGKEPTEKMIIFNEGMFKGETHEFGEQKEKKKEKEMRIVHILMLKKEKHSAEVWLPQRERLQRLVILAPREILQEDFMDAIETINANAVELEKALTLIRKIENDIVDVKLGDAISILPQLESELRKHLHRKMKDLEQKNSEIQTSIDNFFSAMDFLPDEDSGTGEFSSVNSEERLCNLLKMLSDLEEAVKSNEQSKNSIEICQFSSSKIYKLLHALTVSIRKLEEHSSITSLSQTLDIASQLDTAVREYDSIIKRQPFDYVNSERKSRKRRNKSISRDLEEVPAKQHLKNVRQKVFEIVEAEAVEAEERIEGDFDRLDRLEKENDEALLFLEVFLQKTERRVTELANLKSELQKLSSSLSIVYENLFEIIKQRKGKKKKKKMKENEKVKKDEEMKVKGKLEKERKEEKEQEVTRQSLQKKESKDQSVLTNPSRDLSCEVEEKLVKETVSGLLVAIDSLKSRAKEKNRVCKEILSSSVSEKSQNSEHSSRWPSKSSIACENAEQLVSFVKEFRRIGHSSLYLAWTKPKGSFKGSVAGYQIHVDGKLNQKVRNPERLQAVLYSVDLSKSALVELYAVAENSTKILLAIVPFEPDGEGS